MNLDWIHVGLLAATTVLTWLYTRKSVAPAPSAPATSPTGPAPSPAGPPAHETLLQGLLTLLNGMLTHLPKPAGPASAGSASAGGAAQGIDGGTISDILGILQGLAARMPQPVPNGGTTVPASIVSPK
jgi:hypothetical protein